MRAAVGDRIVIASNSLDRPVRAGRVVEVRHPDGSPPYLVEWSDTGLTGLVFPGPDARVESAAHPVATAPAAAEQTVTALPHGRHVRTWHVEVQLFESERETTAHAVLRSGETTPLRSDGHSHRPEGEPDLPEVGDEIAVGRALHQLGDLLLHNASSDLAAAHGHPSARSD
jgi:hypothetical protein